MLTQFSFCERKHATMQANPSIKIDITVDEAKPLFTPDIMSSAIMKNNLVCFVGNAHGTMVSCEWPSEFDFYCFLFVMLRPQTQLSTPCIPT